MGKLTACGWIRKEVFNSGVRLLFNLGAVMLPKQIALMM
jgi:hypothetical protein